MQFKCLHCGKCCRNLEFESDKTGIYTDLFKDSFKGIALLEWEKEALNNYNPRPIKVIYDKKSKKSIVLLWGLEGDDCPFWKNKRCSVHKKRPLMCRSYPLASTGLFTGAVTLLGCIGTYKIKEIKALGSMDIKQANNMLKDIFGNEVYYAGLQSEITEKKTAQYIRKLLDKKIIEPVVGKKTEIENSTKIGFYEFLIEKGILSLRDYQRFVEDIWSYREARYFIEW